ncbi:MAG TPA: pyridoxal phosphate-dependent aminotransferase [Alphaproteobacteria bacterium]|nr:pyridoxal phosphate-dependent aminotransferase [Alphaproteobacteria bacterium]
MKLSARSNISPFIVMEVMAAAAAREAQGGDVLHLEVGQPSTSAPKGVLDAAHQAMRDNRIGYTLALGLPELRQAIAQHYSDAYRVTVNPEYIVVTTGSSAAFLLSFLALFDPGSRVAIASPGYPAYRNILRVLNIEAVLVPCTAETGFQPTPELLRIAAQGGRLDGLLVASPANPTGSMLDSAQLQALSAHCSAQDMALISDEIYHGITYGKVAHTALEFSNDAIVINSFSKYFSMTGWRLGWMIVPEAMLRAVERISQNLFISPPSLSQHAALAAFDCHDELKANAAVYAANRELLLRELPKAGITRFAPADGAFYLYADVSHLTQDSEQFCRRMLAETGVAATPGVDFDPENGHLFIRFSFAGSTGVMAQAAARLKDWLA